MSGRWCGVLGERCKRSQRCNSPLMHVRTTGSKPHATQDQDIQCADVDAISAQAADPRDHHVTEIRAEKTGCEGQRSDRKQLAIAGKRQQRRIEYRSQQRVRDPGQQLAFRALQHLFRIDAARSFGAPAFGNFIVRIRRQPIFVVGRLRGIEESEQQINQQRLNAGGGRRAERGRCRGCR